MADTGTGAVDTQAAGAAAADGDGPGVLRSEDPRDGATVGEYPVHGPGAVAEIGRAHV